MVAVADAFDAIGTVASILTEHGPLDDDNLAQRLRDRGVADPETALKIVLDEIEYPARQLVDDRWAWLPTVLAGKMFTHRLGADELAHDILTVTPDLDPITTLCEHEQYQRFTDGTTARVALPFDAELLDERGIPPEMIDPLGALLLLPGTLRAVGAGEGDLVGVRLTAKGLVVERVSALPQPRAVGERLAAMLEADEPVYFDAAVWTACVEDPAVFIEPLPPLCEIVDDYGLARRGEWLAPGGFDFDRWEFERECARLAMRHDLDTDDAFVLNTLVHLYDQMSLLLIDSDEPPDDAFAAGGEDAEAPEVDGFADLMGDTRGRARRPGAGRAARGRDDRHRPRRRGRAGHVRRGAGAEGGACGSGGVSVAACGGAGADGRHRCGRTRVAGGRVDGSGVAAAVVRPGPVSPPIVAKSSAGWPCCVAPVLSLIIYW